MRLISDMRLAQGVLRAAWCGVLIGLVGPSATASADAPPVCSDATKTVKARTYGAAAIRVHCTDPESQPLKLALMTRPGHARDVDEMVQDIAENAPTTGDQWISYEPDGLFIGTDTFTYTASDGVNTSDVATVTVQIMGPPMDDHDRDGVPDAEDSCPGKRGLKEFDGCAAPKRPGYFFEYSRGSRRSFDYIFWPSGHAGPGAPSTLGDVRYLFRHDPPMVADPTRPQLSLWPTGRGFGGDAWAVYTDSGAAALPASGGACESAGPSPHLTTRQWLGVRRSKTRTRPTAVRCRFHRGAQGYVGVWGRRGGHKPATVTHVIADELSGSRRRTRNRTILRADLSGSRPTLRFDRTRCRRIALPAG